MSQISVTRVKNSKELTDFFNKVDIKGFKTLADMCKHFDIKPSNYMWWGYKSGLKERQLVGMSSLSGITHFKVFPQQPGG